MIRQNGQVVGHEIAELLMEGDGLVSKRNNNSNEEKNSVNESEYSITNDPTLRR